MSILLKKVKLGKKEVDIHIDENKISEISEKINIEAENKIDCTGKTVIPSLFNTHNHASMTLLRGYADDMKLMDWLQNKVWPIEAKMDENDIYIGSKLACLEMIKSGTTFFNDMYWSPASTVKAVKEMGMRANIGLSLLDGMKNGSKEEIKKNFANLKNESSDMIMFSVAPHAIYTVSDENLLWAKEFSEKNSLGMQMHLSETETEVNGCIDKNNLRPVEHLEKIGFLNENLITAHNVWLSDSEISILKKFNVKLNHNPVSNMKLSVGNYFNYDKLKKAGLSISLGTDGCSSNNNLDMFEEMKISALLQKMMSNDPTSLPAKEAFDMATINPAEQLGINSGKIEEGRNADLLLIDLKTPELAPGHNLVSDLVYSANSSCVNTTICNGRILMRDRKVEGEEDIINDAVKCAKNLVEKSK